MVVPPGLVPALPDADDPGLEVAAALFSFTCPETASLQCVAAEIVPVPDVDGDCVLNAGCGNSRSEQQGLGFHGVRSLDYSPLAIKA